MNQTDRLGMTALHWAVRYMHYRVVSLLVHKGAPINATDKCSTTPLDLSLKEGDSRIYEFLHRNGGKSGVELHH